MRIASEKMAARMRLRAMEMVHNAHASHIGAILSCVDIMAVLYSGVLRYRAEDPAWIMRDRFVLSKGHAGVAVYTALAESGFFPVKELGRYGESGGPFSCHVSHKHVPGVEVSTGSLGHGVCMACGMALNGKIYKQDYHVYVLVGDGECNEGAVWETAMLAAQKKLNNFTVIVDRNGMQAMGNCDEVLNMEPLAAKWKDFGWEVKEVDGHDHKRLKQALSSRHEEKPTAVICKTIKGHGVSFMENNLLWHYRDPQGSDYENAMRELEAAYAGSCD